MPAGRKLKFFPTRRPALLSQNLPFAEAVAIYLKHLDLNSRRACVAHFNHMVSYFATVRLRSIHQPELMQYARWRISQGAAASTVEREFVSLGLLVSACYPKDLESLAGVKK